MFVAGFLSRVLSSHRPASCVSERPTAHGRVSHSKRLIHAVRDEQPAVVGCFHRSPREAERKKDTAPEN